MRRYENVKIDKLMPYINNTKKHSREQIKKIQSSIREFGFVNPILIDSNYNIIAGHGRLEGAKEEGLKEIPCLFIEDLTDQQIKAYRIADNKIAEFAEWDMDLLEIEMEGLDDLFTGFDDAEFDDIMGIDKEVEEDDFEVELPDEPKAKLGEIYQLGRHRLMCGDSTSIDDVGKLMDGVKADMVFTDPPYGVSAMGMRGQNFKKSNAQFIKNDELRNDELTQFLSDFIGAMQYKEGASIYICYSWATQKEFTEAIQMNDLKIKNCIIWDKKVFGLNPKGYRPQYEMIYFCCKDDFEWYGDKAQSNIWQISREINREEQGNHPTPKPIELIAKALNNSSKQEDIILDVFGGSGSTLIACEQLDRICYMMELDPKYVDVIIDRWEEYTGEEAVLLNGDRDDRES